MVKNGGSQLQSVDLNASAPHTHETKYHQSNLKPNSKLHSMLMNGNSTAGCQLGV